MTTNQKSPVNGAMVTLSSIACIALALGVILLIVGTVANANVNPYSVALNGANPLPGLGSLVWGGAIFTVGLMALFGWLTAVAVLWHAPAAINHTAPVNEEVSA